MKDAGWFWLVGFIHGIGISNMASICAFSDGALALAGNRTFGRESCCSYSCHRTNRLEQSR